MFITTGCKSCCFTQKKDGYPLVSWNLFSLSASAGSLVVAMPPYTQEITLSLEKLKNAAFPNVPTFLPLYVAPKAWAQSSTKIRLRRLQISTIRSMSAGKPNVCCTMTTLLLGVIFRSRSTGSILQSSSLQSTYTGFNPSHRTGFGTALQVKACSKISSPFSNPSAERIAVKAERPLLNETAEFTPRYSANSYSRSSGAFPLFHLQGWKSNFKASSTSSGSVLGERDMEIGFIVGMLECLKEPFLQVTQRRLISWCFLSSQLSLAGFQGKLLFLNPASGLQNTPS